MKQPGSEGLPLRPLTTGELLDASVNVLRQGVFRLLPLAFALAALEQLLLYPLRRAARVTAPWYFHTYSDLIDHFWLLLGIGFATEGAILVVLGNQAARVAVTALIGEHNHVDIGGYPTGRAGGLARRLPQVGAVGLLAVLIGLVSGASFLAAGLPWLMWFMLAGMVGPVLAIDRRATAPAHWPTQPASQLVSGRPAAPASTTGWSPGPAPVLVDYRPLPAFSAFARGIAMVFRAGLRPGAIRLLGYLAWWPIRLALAAGTIELLKLLANPSGALVIMLSTIAWTLVNGIAYAVLGCLDAVLHLETRMRTEGLDIALSQALRAPAGVRTSVPAALAVPR